MAVVQYKAEHYTILLGKKNPPQGGNVLTCRTTAERIILVERHNSTCAIPYKNSENFGHRPTISSLQSPGEPCNKHYPGHHSSTKDISRSLCACEKHVPKQSSRSCQSQESWRAVCWHLMLPTITGAQPQARDADCTDPRSFKNVWSKAMLCKTVSEILIQYLIAPASENSQESSVGPFWQYFIAYSFTVDDWGINSGLVYSKTAKKPMHIGIRIQPSPSRQGSIPEARLLPFLGSWLWIKASNNVVCYLLFTHALYSKKQYWWSIYCKLTVLCPQGITVRFCLQYVLLVSFSTLTESVL